MLIKHSVPRPYPENLTGPNLHPDITPLLKDPASLSTLENFGLTNDFEGGNVLYKVDYDGFSLVHHGSTGPTDSLEIGALQVKQALQKLGDNGRVDVELGGVAELTYFLDGNGFVDARKYSEDIGAKQYIPIHHSNWLPPLTNDAAYYYEPLKAEWAKSLVSQFPRMCFTTEQNWATVWSFNIAQWTGSQTGPMTPITGPGCYTG
ncbi:MAG: hypothetical protein HOV83_35920 [Catenulispora sp.]|nr:hypothetical protein [Catenulispora sp.]